MVLVYQSAPKAKKDKGRKRPGRLKRAVSTERLLVFHWKGTGL